MMRITPPYTLPFCWTRGLGLMSRVGSGTINSRPREMPWRMTLVLSLLLASLPALAAGKKPRGGGSEPTHVPMALDSEQAYFKVPRTCLGEDDQLDWVAIGSLAPGESFTYVSGYPSCERHAAAISVVATWDSGQLLLESTVPDADYSSWDSAQVGAPVSAPAVGNRAQLCMFPFFREAGIHYEVTLTNTSETAVHGIRLHGRHRNDWPIHYHPRCMNADADGDGWNDSLEHTMANLLYPIGYIDGVLQPDLLWGSNYLRSGSASAARNDEIDSVPVDLDDNGRVDADDVLLIEGWLGEGNGVALQQISPNPGPEWFHENTLPWRRYDIDGDGWVDATDRDIVLLVATEGQSSSADVVPPTARLNSPTDGEPVARGQYLRLQAHAWDNAALVRVDYLVDGKVVCSVTDPVPEAGFESPFYSCWWQVPKRRGLHEIEVIAYDAAGHVASSRPVIVNGE